MATTDQSWMPPAGRHPVNIGKSLARALKARKGLPTKPNKNLPTSDFYLFRYNFKPESVDSTRPGTVEVSQGKDATVVRVERASNQPNEVHQFRGKEEPSKEVDCVLVYNEEDGTFTLEKLDSSLTLTYDGRGVAKSRPSSASPLPTPPPAASSSKIEQDDLQAELERELLTTLDDAEGEIDDEFEEIVPTSSKSSKLEVREEEINVIPQSRPPQPKPKARTKADANKKPNLTPGQTTSSQAKGKGKRDLQRFDVEVEEEDLEFGQPTKPTKRTRSSPPLSQGLALPSSSSITQLPSQSSPSRRVAPRLVDPPVPLPQRGYHSDSESQEEWDEITRPASNADQNDNDVEGSIFGGDAAGEEEDAGEEIDLNEFAAEMDQALENEEEEDVEADPDADFLSASASHAPRVPISLNQFAGGQAEQDDDDYSSSDDSSDD